MSRGADANAAGLRRCWPSYSLSAVRPQSPWPRKASAHSSHACRKKSRNSPSVIANCSPSAMTSPTALPRASPCSTGKPVQEGVRVRLAQGTAWEGLTSITPEEIKSKKLWPAGFYPLPHPHHEAGGMVFPQPLIDETKRQTGRDLTRFDLDYDFPQHLLPEFPAHAASSRTRACRVSTVTPTVTRTRRRTPSATSARTSIVTASIRRPSAASMFSASSVLSAP